MLSQVLNRAQVQVSKFCGLLGIVGQLQVLEEASHPGCESILDTVSVSFFHHLNLLILILIQSPVQLLLEVAEIEAIKTVESREGVGAATVLAEHHLGVFEVVHNRLDINILQWWKTEAIFQGR